MSEDLKNTLMKTLTLERNNIHSTPNQVISERGCNQASKCNFCGHYKLQRGSVGHCQLLNAPVRGGWKSCALAMPPFAPSWEYVECANVSPGVLIN
jgi:hypothetical protein